MLILKRIYLPRLISIQPILSKVAEKLIKPQLNDYVIYIIISFPWYNMTSGRI